jgi:hypothetical protein
MRQLEPSSPPAAGPSDRSSAIVNDVDVQRARHPEAVRPPACVPLDALHEAQQAARRKRGLGNKNRIDVERLANFPECGTMYQGGYRGYVNPPIL